MDVLRAVGQGCKHSTHISQEMWGTADVAMCCWAQARTAMSSSRWTSSSTSWSSSSRRCWRTTSARSCWSCTSTRPLRAPAAFSDAVYNANAHVLLHDDACFRLESREPNGALTVQLLDPDRTEVAAGARRARMHACSACHGLIWVHTPSCDALIASSPVMHLYPHRLPQQANEQKCSC